MTGLPLISVVIPYYNEATLLPRAVESVFSQTYEGPIEVIVSDDASLTPPPSIASRNNRSIKQVVSPKNNGAAATRNLGAAAANGIYLTFLDADDVYLEDRVAEHVTFIHRYPEAGIVGGKHIVHRDETVLETPSLIKKHYPSLSEQTCVLPSTFRRDICKAYCFVTGAITIRRDIFEEIGGFAKQYCWGEEWDLVVRAAQLTRVGYVATPAQRYLCRENSITSTRNPQKYSTAAQMYLDWINSVKGLSSSDQRSLKKLSSRWRLLSAQMLYEEQADQAGAWLQAAKSVWTWPTTWGLRSLLRYSLPHILETKKCS